MSQELSRIGIFDLCPVCDEGELEPFEPSTRLWGQKGYACPKCGRIIVDKAFQLSTEEATSDG